MKLDQPLRLPPVFGTKAPTAQNQNHRIGPLQLRQSAMFAGLIGQLRSVGEKSARSVLHGVQVPGDAGHHRRRAAGRGLGDRHAPSLPERGAGQDPGRPVQRQQIVVAEVAGQRQPSGGARGADAGLEGGALVALTDDHRLEAGMAFPQLHEYVDEHLEALDRHEPPGGHDERVGRTDPARREARGDAR